CALSFTVCFFFQAEDGIRDRNVTGVQTCALPISKALGLASIVLFAVLVCVTAWQVFSRQVLHSPSTWSEELSKLLFVWLSFAGKIGRASCRERVERSVWACS